MFPTTILVVDADDSLVETIGQVAASVRGCRLEATLETEAALRRLARGDVGLVLAYLPDGREEPRIMRLTRGLSELPVRVPLVVISECESPGLRLRLLRLGAADCLSRPMDLSRLAFLLDLLTIRRRREPPVTPPAGAPAAPALPACIEGFVFVGQAMQRLLEEFHAVAPLETTLLLTGKTGTGKTHLARVIHAMSGRKAKPLVVVSCSALSPSLLESELFGHVRGAFTGADSDYAGKFADAQDGTVLLDEIDCVPLEIQVKLLRAVEDRVYEPVGSTRSRPFRARLIAATNRPLEEEIAAGRFRSDLYYRLNVVGFALPPLRSQQELILPMARRFLSEYCTRHGRQIEGFSPEAARAIETHDWPGNVRELRNVVERAVALCRGGTIDLADLAQSLRCRPDAPPLPEKGKRLADARASAEAQRLTEALRRHGNNRTFAAAELGISRVTLYKKLHRYGLI